MSMLPKKKKLQTTLLEKMNTEDNEKAPMELMEEEKLLKEFEDIMININEYCKAFDEKIELIEEIVVDLRADPGKARKITTHFYQTIEKFKESCFKKDTKKVRTELSELSFRPQTSQGNASNPLSLKREREA